MGFLIEDNLKEKNIYSALSYFFPLQFVLMSVHFLVRSEKI